MKRALLAAVAVGLVVASIAGAQVGRTPNFGDSFIRDANTPVQVAVVTAAGQLATSNQGRRATYSASISGLVLPNTAGATGIIISGATSGIIRVNRISFESRATTVATSDVILVKRSTAPTGGTATNPIKVAHDSSAPAASAVVSSYTVTPTLGTIVGMVRAAQWTYANLTTGLGEGPAQVWFFGDVNGQPITLRGANETLSVELPAGGPAGNLTAIDVEWTESQD